MLKSKSVAKLIQTTLNMNDSEKFRVVYEVGGYKGADINCILKQGKGTIRPILNYTNVNTPYTLEIIVPTGCGEDRIDGIVDIVNGVIGELNGKVKNIDNGKAVLLFSPLEIGQYDTRATAGQSVIMKLDFAVDYSSKSGTKYEMALITNEFDAGTQNTRYHEDRESQIKWFDDRIKDASWNEVLTPNINSLVVTQQRYINSASVDMNSLVMKNYAIIRETKWNDEVNYYYYYITNSNIDQYNIVTIDLKMDTVQTIYFNPELKICDCTINKAHLDRLKKTTENLQTKYQFKFDESSPLFEREEIKEVAKRPIVKQKLYPDMTGSGNLASGGINKWFADNVSHWIYYYISAGKDYVIRDALGSIPTNSDNIAKGTELQSIKFTTGQLDVASKLDDNNIIDGGVVVLVAPVYKTNKKIYIPYSEDGSNMTGYRVWDMTAIKTFLKDKVITGSTTVGEEKVPIWTENGNYANVFAIKNSLMPPLPVDARYETIMSVDGNGDLYYNARKDAVTPDAHKNETKFFDVRNRLEFYSGFKPDEEYKPCYARVIYQDLQDELNFIVENPMYNGLFSDTEVLYNKPVDKVEPLFNYGLEPKLLNEDYSTYRLYIGGNTFDLPISKTSQKPTFIYKEIMTPDITKAMLIYDANKSYKSSNVFTEINKKDFTGFMIELDLSMWFTNDSLDSYLATNKNNLQIMKNNQRTQQINTLFNTVGNVGGGLMNSGFKSLPNSLLGSAINVGSLAIQQMNENTNYNLTLDNMAQSPQSLSALNSNALLIQNVDELGIFIEMQIPLSREIEIIANTLKKNGYTLNQIDNVRNYDNTRSAFNYIEAIIENVLREYTDEETGSIKTGAFEVSDSILQDLRDRFINGIRFWHTDKLDYNLPNYERWVEDEL